MGTTNYACSNNLYSCYLNCPPRTVAEESGALWIFLFALKLGLFYSDELMNKLTNLYQQFQLILLGVLNAVC